jgi:hypothetical protein
MHALTAADVLDVWEQGSQAHPLVRPLAVLAAAWPELDPAALAAEPLGAVNARLWAVRAALVGTAVVGCVECPACGDQVELELDATDLAVPAAGPAGAGVRPLTPADLFAAAAAADPAAVLVARCAPDAADPEAALAAADPGAELLLALSCPGCGCDWQAPLDVAVFLWDELVRLAGAVVRDVDLLARCYGWTEPDVLGLSPARRRCYVELARGAG